jgi:hypothetical protein
LNYIIDNCYLNKWFPGHANCNLIIRLNAVPTKPENMQILNKSTPISLVISRKQPTGEWLSLLLFNFFLLS